ncbi:ATP-binding protein [soil metagenome]
MAVVIGTIGLVVYLRFESQLDATLNQGLRSRSIDVRALVAKQDGTLAGVGRGVEDEEDSFAQVVDPRGAIVDATPQLRRARMLSAAEVRRALAGAVTVDGVYPFEDREPVRMVLRPVRADGRQLVVMVGTSTEDRDEALGNLAGLFAIGGPLALLLASLAGYGVAAAALRPVEAMRRKAGTISEHRPGERLPVAVPDDEIARLGTTLNTMLARLEAAFARERTFVADASHELRTPLAILKTELELALRHGRTHEELQQALRSAAEETERLAQLAESLLVIARADQGQLALSTAPVDAAQLLDGVRRRFASRAQLAQREILVEDGSAAQITADPHRLEQALDNLVENALRHGDGTILLSASVRDGHAALHVRDEGPGFPADFIASAFDRFTRADQARGRGGSGLGLAIVQVIARAHGGQVRAGNAPQGGADVRIELPAS